MQMEGICSVLVYSGVLSLFCVCAVQAKRSGRREGGRDGLTEERLTCLVARPPDCAVAWWHARCPLGADPCVCHGRWSRSPGPDKQDAARGGGLWNKRWKLFSRPGAISATYVNTRQSCRLSPPAWHWCINNRFGPNCWANYLPPDHCFFSFFLPLSSLATHPRTNAQTVQGRDLCCCVTPLSLLLRPFSLPSCSQPKELTLASRPLNTLPCWDYHRFCVYMCVCLCVGVFA